MAAHALPNVPYYGLCLTPEKSNDKLMFNLRSTIASRFFPAGSFQLRWVRCFSKKCPVMPQAVKDITIAMDEALPHLSVPKG